VGEGACSQFSPSIFGDGSRDVRAHEARWLDHQDELTFRCCTAKIAGTVSWIPECVKMSRSTWVPRMPLWKRCLECTAAESWIRVSNAKADFRADPATVDESSHCRAALRNFYQWPLCALL